MKKLISQINIDSLQEAEDILKSAGEEELFEKAKHQDGDMHPNGKWVWVSSANGGKGDWRTKGGRTHTKHSAGGNAGTGSATTTQQKPTSQNTVKTKKRPIAVGTNGPEKRNVKISLPDKMESLSSDMNKKDYLSDKRPYTYTDNGFNDLSKQGAKGYGIWVGFQHNVRGKQPVNRNQLSNFVRNTAVEHLLKEVNQKTGKKYSKEDVVIEDKWDATDMFRIYIKTE